MKNNLTRILLSAVILTGMFLSSCKKDEPYVKPKLSFSSATQTAVESDDSVKVAVKLDKAADKDFTISYSLTGTAKEKATVATNYPYDYQDVNAGSLVIKKGETTGNIKLNVFTDFYMEDAETIILKIDKVSVDNVEITTDNTTTLTLNQEDGKIIELDWNYPNDVDMDLILWIGDDANSLDAYAGSAYRGTGATVAEQYEQVFLPAVIKDATFGLSYVYYSGSASPMDFSVIFVDVKNNVIEAQANWDTYNGQYTSANLNEWSDITDLTIREQVFSNTGGVYSTIPAITTPATGSRMATHNNSKVKFQLITPSKSFLHR